MGNLDRNHRDKAPAMRVGAGIHWGTGALRGLDAWLGYVSCCLMRPLQGPTLSFGCINTKVTRCLTASCH